MDVILRAIESFLYGIVASLAESLQHFLTEYPTIGTVLLLLSPIWLWYLARFSYELIHELSYQKVRFIRWLESKMEESEESNHE